MLKKISSEEPLEDRSTPELDALKHRDWVRRRNRVHRKDNGSVVCLSGCRQSRHADRSRCVAVVSHTARLVCGCS